MHAGTGGVGLAALQVARARGCQVLATAGSSAKRGILRRMGMARTADSRSTVFSDTVAAAAAGGGVDVVLNSLTSPGMVAASLASLSRHGRFAEIAKRDIWSAVRVAQGAQQRVAWGGGCIPWSQSRQRPSSNSPRPYGTLIPSAAERPDVQYRLVAIDFLPGSVLNANLRELAHMLAADRVAPLPHLAYSFEDSAAAFRQFARAQHVGKIVVRVPPPAETAQSSGGSWVVSGGLGALGALTAAWLAGHGQRHLLLLGRSGR